jgi:DNA modification methylase
MDGEKAQLVVTDPPYGVEYDGTHLSSGAYFAGGQRVDEKLEGDNAPSLYYQITDLLYGITDDKASCYLFFAGAKGFEVYDAIKNSQWEILALIFWNKNHAQFGSMGSQYKQKHEPILYLFKRGKSTRWFGATNEVTVWDYDRASKNEHHLTQKPVELFSRPISNNTEKEHIVFDGFLGSGTTLIACERLGRKCRAVEISPAYCAVAIERWADMTGQEPELVSSD